MFFFACDLLNFLLSFSSGGSKKFYVQRGRLIQSFLLVLENASKILKIHWKYLRGINTLQNIGDSYFLKYSAKNFDCFDSVISHLSRVKK